MTRSGIVGQGHDGERCEHYSEAEAPAGALTGPAKTVYEQLRQLVARGDGLDECLSLLMTLIGHERAPVEQALAHARGAATRPGADVLDRNVRWLLQGALSTGLFYRS